MIKKAFKTFIPQFCTMCLGISTFINFKYSSFAFFGEPEYPIPADDED